MAPGISTYDSYLLEAKAPQRKTFLVSCSGWLGNPLIYVRRQGDQSPQGCIKHVRAGSCTSIKADKCFVQLMGGQIATPGGTGELRGLKQRRAAPSRDGGGRGRAERRARAGHAVWAWYPGPSLRKRPSLPCGRWMSSQS